MSGDWAAERAREWLDCDEGMLPDTVSSLAALLREVEREGAQRRNAAMDLQRSQLIAEVRRVVEERRDTWDESAPRLACDEILRRLEAL